MAESIRILMLEDNPVDAELIQFELQEAGLIFTAKVVVTEKEYIQAIQDYCPDLILSDYDLPTYNGALALVAAKRTCPDTPFILVTGAVSEDRAIEILTQGAKDYVLKTRLEQRLVPAVRRALAEAEEHKERKKAEEELKAASLYSRTLIEVSLDPLVTISLEGKVMDVNKATEEITGLLRKQIIGTDFSDYFTEPEKARTGYEKMFSEGSVKDYPLAIRHINGCVANVLYNATVYKNEKGEVQGIFAAARDVTELKKAEEELRESHRTMDEQVKIRTAELEAIISSMAVGLIVYNVAGKAVRMNDTAKKLLPEEIFFNMTVEERARIIRWETEKGQPFPPEEIPVACALRGETTHNVIIAASFPDHKLWISASAAPIRSKDGRMLGVVASFIDITASKHTEEILQDSEKRYRRLFEAAKDGIVILDAATGKIDDVNPYLLKLLGYSYDELCGKHIWELGVFKDIVASRKAFKVLQDNEYIRYDDLPLETINGQIIAVEFVSNVYLVDHHKVIQCNIRDITGQKRTEDALRESEEQFRTIAETLPVLISLTRTEDSTIVFTNTYYNEAFGFHKDEIIGRKGPDVYCDPADRTNMLDTIREQGFVCNYELKAKKSDGTPIWLLSSVQPIFYKGKPAIIGASIDITKRKKAEEALEESEKKYRELVKYAPIGIYEIDFRSRKLVTINDAMILLTGYAREEMLAMDVLDILDDESKKAFTARIGKMLKGEKQDENVEYKVIAKDGHIIHAILHVSFKINEQGTPIGATVVGLDVTERKQADELLQKTIQRLQVLVSGMRNSILLVEEDCVEIANQAFCDYFDLRESPQDLIGLSAHEMIEKIKNAYLHPEEEVTRIREIVKLGQPVIGEEIAMQGGKTCLRDFIPMILNGKAYDRVWIHTDITERKQTEEVLKEQARQLEDANKELESFSYSVSHDLKAPLRAIEGYSRMLLKKDADKLSDDTIRKLDVIRSNTAKMSSLIDDLLSFSRVLKSSIVIAEINMDKLVKEVWAEMQAVNMERELEFRITKMLPGLGDPALIRQVLVNLLANAVKFTKTRKPGVIEMSSYSESDKIVYCIKDNGVGFDMEYYNKLYGVFQRLHGGEEYEGTGIGLAIVQRIVSRHCGKVWAEGKVNEGATFYFSLPTHQV